PDRFGTGGSLISAESICVRISIYRNDSGYLRAEVHDSSVDQPPPSPGSKAKRAGRFWFLFWMGFDPLLYRSCPSKRDWIWGECDRLSFLPQLHNLFCFGVVLECVLSKTRGRTRSNSLGGNFFTVVHAAVDATRPYEEP